MMKPLTDRRWPGYTLEELRAQKAINDSRIDVEKHDIQRALEILKSKQQTNNGSIFKKILGALTYVDYAVMGITLIKKIAGIAGHFRRTKTT